MDLETAKHLVKTKLVIHNRINKHYTREDWRDNDLSSLFTWLNSTYGGTIQYQVKILLEHNGIVPKNCENCNSEIDFQTSMILLCKTCKKREANDKRRLTNLAKYGHVSPTGNSEIQKNQSKQS